MTVPPAGSAVHKRKLIIFYLTVILMFYTSMAKMLVPGTVFAELQGELGFSAGTLAGMGAYFMYGYAFSQLGLGLLSTRYGGVRILLFGGTLFALGSLLFPLLSQSWAMSLARGITGVGAGTVFVALAKLIDDLFPRQFAMVLGITLFIGYFGPVAGGIPMVVLVKSTTWRIALLIPAVISVLAMAGIWCSARGTLKKVTAGQTLGPLLALLKNRPTRRLFFASSIVFGSYYAILTTVGQKALEDCAGMGHYAASGWITVLAVIVALNNIIANLVLKWIGGRRQVLIRFAACCSLAGTLLGAAAFFLGLPGTAIVAAFLLVAIPAGFFSIFGTVAKELNPPEYVGLAVAILNFFAFVAIALAGNLAGMLLAAYEKTAANSPAPGGLMTYPPEAYGWIFGVFALVAGLGTLIAFKIPETNPERSRRAA